MIVHLIGSARDIENDMPFIEVIFESVNKNGDRIIRDWPHAAFERYKRKSLPDSKVDWHNVFRENIEAITKSDVIIVEASTYSLNQGYYLCEALKQNKPTLLVTRQSLQSRSVSGIYHDELQMYQYTNSSELQELVDDFLKEAKTRTAAFNLR